MNTAGIRKFEAYIAQEWQRLIATLAQQHVGATRETHDLARILHSYLLNTGKLFRPILFILGYELYSQKPASRKILHLALSLELLHIHLLIQDDIVDASPLRRGHPSLHIQLATLHKKKRMRGNSRTYGQNMAMLLSEVLLNEAEKIWTESELISLTSPKTRSLFEAMKTEVYWGQVFDLAVASATKFPGASTIIKIMEEKTSKYSVWRPLLLGALTAGANEHNVVWMKNFSIELGIAFQGIDDVLGVFGNPKITGKSSLSDIKERKKTLLAYYAYHASRGKDRRRFMHFYATRRATKKSQLLYIRGVMYHTCADKKLLAFAYKRYDIALQLLSRASLVRDKKQLLASFAERLVRRNK